MNAFFEEALDKWRYLVIALAVWIGSFRVYYVNKVYAENFGLLNNLTSWLLIFSSAFIILFILNKLEVLDYL